MPLIMFFIKNTVLKIPCTKFPVQNSLYHSYPEYAIPINTVHRQYTQNGVIRFFGNSKRFAKALCKNNYNRNNLEIQKLNIVGVVDGKVETYYHLFAQSILYIK